MQPVLQQYFNILVLLLFACRVTHHHHAPHTFNSQHSDATWSNTHHHSPCLTCMHATSATNSSQTPEGQTTAGQTSALITPAKSTQIAYQRGSCYGCGAQLQTQVAAAAGYVKPDKYEVKKRHRQLNKVRCSTVAWAATHGFCSNQDHVTLAVAAVYLSMMAMRVVPHVLIQGIVGRSFQVESHLHANGVHTALCCDDEIVVAGNCRHGYAT